MMMTPACGMACPAWLVESGHGVGNAARTRCLAGGTLHIVPCFFFWTGSPLDHDHDPLRRHVL